MQIDGRGDAASVSSEQEAGRHVRHELPADEQLSIVETALRQLREQFRAGRLDAASESRERLSVAADALTSAHETDSELTAFTTLDRDDYDAAR